MSTETTGWLSELRRIPLWVWLCAVGLAVVLGVT